MVGLSAVLFVPDDTAKTGYREPMMLHSMQGAPLLTWLTRQLREDGVGRFFLVCGDRYLAKAKACLPDDVEVMTTESEAAADLLHVFLSTANEDEREVTVVAGPALYLPAFAGNNGRSSCVFSADREALMDALDDTFSFSEFLRERCAVLSESDGFFPVPSPAAAMELADLLRKNRMLELERGGVTVYDPSNCYAEPTVVVEPGAVLLPGTILRGKTIVREGAVVGPNTVAVDSEIGTDARVTASHLEQSKVGAEATVGPFAHLRGGAEVRRGAHVGNFVELKNTTLGDHAFASHLSYLGDAEIGDRVNLGCGTVTVNFDRVNKYPTVIGDDAFVGCQSALVAPVRVGSGAYVAAGTVVTEDVPDQALAIGRARQNNKKEWAAKHKRP